MHRHSLHLWWHTLHMHSRLHHHSRLLHHAWLLLHLTAAEQLVNFLKLFALFVSKLANESQHSGQVNLLFVE